jgi:hypothetical protein
MSTFVQPLAGVRVDEKKIAARPLRCLVCKKEIAQGASYVSSGTTDDAGEIPYRVNFHAVCLSAADARVDARAA